MFLLRVVACAAAIFPSVASAGSLAITVTYPDNEIKKFAVYAGRTYIPTPNSPWSCSAEQIHSGVVAISCRQKNGTLALSLAACGKTEGLMIGDRLGATTLILECAK